MLTKIIAIQLTILRQPKYTMQKWGAGIREINPKIA